MAMLVRKSSVGQDVLNVSPFCRAFGIYHPAGRSEPVLDDGQMLDYAQSNNIANTPFRFLGLGASTVAFSGRLADYTVRRIRDGAIVTDAHGETEVLDNVRYLAFADGTLDLARPTARQRARKQAAKAPAPAVATAAVDTGRLAILLNDDGTVTYRPLLAALGKEAFTYRVTGPGGEASEARVVVDVELLADEPVDAGGAEGEAPVVDLHDGSTLAGGSVVTHADGSYTYHPPAGFAGTDAFSYTVTDPQGGQAAFAVHLTVENAAVPPFEVTASGGGADPARVPALPGCSARAGASAAPRKDAARHGWLTSVAA